MPKIKEIFVCNSCGFEAPRWSGQCPSCKEWNTFEEQIKSPAKNKLTGFISQNITPTPITEVDVLSEVRYKTGVEELDRVLGGGIVKGSLILLGGDPGIGKSTLLLQICEPLGKNLKILYVSGEESTKQIKLRADRLGVTTANLSLVSCTDIDTIVHTISTTKPHIVMIDSIQTMSVAAVGSSAGSVTQVRESTTALMQLAKTEDIPVIIVGHVNKDGAIAGPKVLEHIVDAVLYFEGERQLSYRILRGVKNRYGSTNEIGVFEMQSAGLVEVTNPSMMLLTGRPCGVSGTCVVCVMEGTRPILVEVQALVTKSGFAAPRRVCTGFDYNRMALIIAVLEKRAGYFFGNLDAYVNVVGGLKLDEPAADLAVAIALVSSLRDKAIDEHILAFGELGLAGEIRNVSAINQRVKEAQRLGFKKCIVPKQSLLQINSMSGIDIEVVGVEDIKEAFRNL